MVTKRLPVQSASQFIQQKGFICCDFLWSHKRLPVQSVSQFMHKNLQVLQVKRPILLWSQNYDIQIISIECIYTLVTFCHHQTLACTNFTSVCNHQTKFQSLDPPSFQYPAASQKKGIHGLIKSSLSVQIRSTHSRAFNYILVTFYGYQTFGWSICTSICAQQVLQL